MLTSPMQPGPDAATGERVAASGPSLSTWLHRLMPPLGLAMFGAALWSLHREFAHLHLKDIEARLQALPLSALATAVGLAILSYVVLTGYDLLSLRYLGRRLGIGRPALASFLGYSVSQNVGFALLSGAPIRLRLYSAWGLSALEITALMAFNGLTFWLGLLTVGGLAFTIAGGATSTASFLPLSTLRPVGVLFLLVVLGYLVLCLRLPGARKLGRWELKLPPPRLALLQLAVSSADWTVSASVLWVLLPPEAGVAFPHFMTVYLLGQLVGIASQVPGGVGVFETVVISLLPRGVDSSVVLGPLIAYRVVYYLLPLVTALLCLAVYEIAQRRHRLGWVSGTVGTGLALVAPHLLAVTTFFGGAVLLLSGATPATSSRLRWLNEILPLPALELSHFLASIVGVLLLILAWGLRRRLESAYYLALGLLGVGAALSLLKGVDYEEASVLTIMLLALAPTRRSFYRKTPMLSEPLSPGWLVSVTMVLVGVLWVGLFAYRHVSYSNELWWQFTLHGDASRFLRGGVAAAVSLVAFGVARLLGSATPREREPSSDDLEHVRELVAASPDASANLALLGDKRFLLSPSDRSMIMYGVKGRSWIAMGGPIGAKEEWADLAWTFHSLCDRHGGWTVFYEVGEEHLSMLLELGLTVLRIGEEAVVPLAGFTLEGRDRKELRYVRRKLEREGCTFEVLAVDDVDRILPELRAISDSWLEAKHTREKGFSLGRFEEEYLRRFPVALVRVEGRAVAFANLWQGSAGGELSIDLMRHLPEAPRGVMDFLFTNLMEWGRDRGFERFGLGMAPLAGLRTGPFATLWSRLASLAYRHGEFFYNFQGLRQYKDKFNPEWRPRYLACPGGRAVPGVLTDLAALISGGLLGAIRR